jgi:hypothetical protein
VSKTFEQIRDGARPLLDEGEEIVAALVASPRGAQTAAQLGAAGAIGRKWTGKHVNAAETTGLVIHRNVGIAVTRSRLLTLDVSISMMGAVKDVKEIASAVPLSEISSIKSKWNVLTITTAGGSEIKLEANPGRSKEFAAAFGDLKASV